MTLDKLRALAAAASPGPWIAATGGAFFENVKLWADDDVLALFAHAENMGANAALAALSHLLLPAYEALELERAREEGYHEPLCDDDHCAGCHTRKALKALEEALNDS